MNNIWFFINTKEDTGHRMILEISVQNWEASCEDMKIRLIDEKQNIEINTVFVQKKDSMFSFVCENVSCWDIENPYLYRLNIEVRNAAGETMQYETKVGFRILERKGQEVLWNHKPIKLKGICYRENVSDWENTRKDMLLFKEAGVNYLRGIFTPFSEALLSFCDEIGLFVENTAPFYEIGTERKAIQDLPHERARFMDETTKLLKNGNHVSILLWSLGHDCAWGSNFSAAAKLIKSLDSIRLLTFHLPMSVPEEDFMLDVWPIHYIDWKLPLDVCYDQMVIFHTPGSENEIGYMTAQANYKIPVLHDIWAPVPCHNRDEIQQCSGIHSFWGESIQKFVEKSKGTPGCLGGAVLAGVDEDGSFEDMGGYQWGILDKHHNPKMEYRCLQNAYLGKNSFHIDERFANENKDAAKIDDTCQLSSENEETLHWTIRKERTGSGEQWLISNGKFEYRFSGKTYLLDGAWLNGKHVLAGGPYLNTTGYLLGQWHGTNLSMKKLGERVQVMIEGTYEDSLDVRFVLDLLTNGTIHTSYEILKIHRHLPHTVKAGIGVAIGTLNEKGAAYLIPKEMTDYDTFHHPEDMTVTLENGCQLQILAENVNSIKFEKAPQFTSAAIVDDRDSRVCYQGTWYQMDDYSGNYVGTETLSSCEGDSLEIKFVGTGISLYGAMDMNQGLCDVYVDGEKAAEHISQALDKVDIPGLSRGYEKRYRQKFFEIHHLKEEEHSIKVVVKGEKAPASQNTYISFDYAVLEGALYPVGTLLKCNQDYNYNRLVRGCYVRPKVQLIVGEVQGFTIQLQEQ